MNPINYSIGSPDTATVYITAPGVTNLPPFVDLASPTNGQTFSAPTDIPLLAQASAPDGEVTNVEFFAGTNDLGHGLPVVLDPLGSGGIAGLVYWLNWPNVPADRIFPDGGGHGQRWPFHNFQSGNHHGLVAAHQSPAGGADYQPAKWYHLPVAGEHSHFRLRRGFRRTSNLGGVFSGTDRLVSDNQ